MGDLIEETLAQLEQYGGEDVSAYYKQIYQTPVE